ncbi:ICE-like protease [Myxococcus stipitatus DSM 14675]|uniref:ICE-like protease n=1 Tax=Myxococcus stipitatus (strain DSM 14675 / JCM 12634 / Mx s8) TaxID=1278073 RepID=L7U7B2_MYXSD|nr:caspase family protein [Myxococcus stipitatus]AGC43973.1 ICE-like protease [Myxococcus stipitatus DSM 14675]
MTVIRCFVLAAVLCATLPAQAGTRRIAVLVGHNVGSGTRPPLRYAEADAAKLAGVLSELGDVAASDLIVLQGKDLATVRRALETAAKKVDSLRGAPDTRVVLLFYFSGHSDGVALELGTERLPYKDLRNWLEATRADVRLAIVDSCRSGALLQFKGGRPGPSFELRLTDEVHSTGHALLTSSAEDELALESREVGGSLFTHHLVSGLRGAADASGDGLVTLGEAYQYAYFHTVSATADVLTGAQHPAYAYRLTGKGELVLTQLPSPGTALELPPDFERALLLRTGRGPVLAELGLGAVPRLAVPPGEYELRAWRGGQQYIGTVNASWGQVLKVGWADLQPVGQKALAGLAKGALESAGEGAAKPSSAAALLAGAVSRESKSSSWERPRVGEALPGEQPLSPAPLNAAPDTVAVTTPPSGRDVSRLPSPFEDFFPESPTIKRELSMSMGARHTVIEPSGALLTVRLEVSQAKARGLTFSLELGKGSRNDSGEFISGVGMGYAWKKRGRHTELSLGLEASVQLVVQSPPGRTFWTVGPAAVPVASFGVYLMPELALLIGGRVPVVFMRVDDKNDVRVLPALDLGLRMPL